MNQTIKNKIMVFGMAAILGIISLFCWFKPHTDYSDSERRVLAKFPSLTLDTVTNGKFMSEFETYTLDQFPLRDTFRGLKSFFSLYLMGQSDVNDLTITNGYVAKNEYPANEAMLENAGKKFRYLYDTYMKDSNVNLYFSIVPDKNYYTSIKSGSLAMDYKMLVDTMTKQTDYMKYIDLFQVLSIRDYYRTDTHWKQENLVPVAIVLSDVMGVETSMNYTKTQLEEPFYGVYYGQLALPLSPDTITYLTNEIVESCIVTDYNSGKPVTIPMYDLSQATAKDPYELFVGGNTPLVTIENPLATTDKELVIFRDSFTSSLAPLLATGYSKVTLVDIRYINSGMLGNFIEFDNQDVLFLYSTLVLNSSTILK